MNPDQRALLDAIREAPDDDALRLIYADWLDEHAEFASVCGRCGGKGRYSFNGAEFGYTVEDCNDCNKSGAIGGNGFAERAEFIRAQCANPTQKLTCQGDRHVGQPCPFYPSWKPYARQFCPTCDDLLDDGVPWQILGESSEDQKPSYTVRRGFIDSIACDWETCRDHLDDILKEHPVRKVRLTNWPDAHSFDYYFVKFQHKIRWPSVEFELLSGNSEWQFSRLNFPATMGTHGFAMTQSRMTT